MPLIVLTADRPPELRDVGAGQAIDQIKLYGSVAKWFVEVGNHEPGPRDRDPPPRARLPRVLDRARRQARARAPELPAARAARARARGARPRPTGRAGRTAAPWTELREPRARRTRRRAWLPRGSPRRPRGVIVCGPGVEDVAEAAPGWPPRRLAGAGRADLRRALRATRPLARDRALRRAAARRGVRGRARGPSSCCAWATCPPRSRCAPGWPTRPQVVVDPHGAGTSPPARRSDPARPAARRSTRSPRVEMRAQRSRIPAGSALAPGRRAGAGRAGGGARRRSSRRHARRSAGAARRRDRVGLLVDADARRGGVLPGVDRALRFLANRGANGIDGVASSARAPRWRTRPARPAPDRRARAAARHRRPDRRAPRRRRSHDRLRRTTAAAGSSTSCPWPSTPTPRPTRSTSPLRRRAARWPTRSTEACDARSTPGASRGTERRA